MNYSYSLQLGNNIKKQIHSMNLEAKKSTKALSYCLPVNECARIKINFEKPNHNIPQTIQLEPEFKVYWGGFQIVPLVTFYAG